MIKTFPDGSVKIGRSNMIAYRKAERAKPTDLHEFDKYFSAKLDGLQGVSSLDDSFCRAEFGAFYDDCLAGIQRLEVAIGKAAGVSGDFKDDIRQRKQLEIIQPALSDLLKDMHEHIVKFKDRVSLTERRMQEVMEPELAVKGEQTIIEELKAQEIRAAFRGILAEARTETLRNKLKAGDLFILRAVKDDPIGLVQEVTIRQLEADFLNENARWLFVMADDMVHLLRQIKTRAQLVCGIAWKLMKDGDNGKIQYPQVAPWMDGRFFSESADEGFLLRIPQIPESYTGNHAGLTPVYYARNEALFTMKMAV